MEKVLFSGNLNIRVQGDSALDFLGENSGVSSFKLNHFDSPKITIKDHRDGIIDGVNKYFDTGSPDEFLGKFNTNARVEVIECNEDIQVEFWPLESGSVEGYLWSAIGLTEGIPAYDYQIWQIKPLGEDQFGLFSIFLTPQPRANQPSQIYQSLDVSNRI